MELSLREKDFLAREIGVMKRFPWKGREVVVEIKPVSSTSSTKKE